MKANSSLTYFIKRKKYQDQILEDIDDAEKVLSKSGQINLKSFDLHDELNKTFWNDDDKLRSDIRKQLLQIAHDFYDTLDISEIASGEKSEKGEDETFDKYIKDVLFVGSLASFNYSSYADVDLHLLMDENALTDGNELALNILKKYFTECKNDWNLKHSDLKIEGYDCELYVQDVNEENASNGVYSLTRDEWIKHPEKLDTENFDKSWIEKKAIDYIEQIDSLEETINSQTDLELIKKAKDELKKIKDKIVQGRRDSLAAGQGEMNKYNILFKILRRSNHIEKINDLMTKSYDILNSIKSKNNKKKDLKKESKDMKMRRKISKKFLDHTHDYDDIGLNDSIEEAIVSDTEAMADLKRMYGAKAADALNKYLTKRIHKSAAEVVASDTEFDKFVNWAYTHLGVDVYERFSKYDVGPFYKRTSGLLKNPEQRDDHRNRIDNVEYTVVDQDKDWDDSVDSKVDSIRFKDDEIEDDEEETVIQEDEEKISLVIGDIDDANSIIIIPMKPAPKEADEVLKLFGIDKWTEQDKYSYIDVAMPIKDVESKLNPLANKFNVEIQASESNNSELVGKLNESNADELIDKIKAVLKRHLIHDPATDEANSEFDYTLSAQDAIDEIVTILY